MKLDERKFLILQAIIDDYIMTAIPVGSRTISRKSGVGFSPATIRNEMSDLEELGYLDQPHTSAGRVPSAKAYRLYVDRLMKRVELSEDETARMRAHLHRRTAQVDEVISQTAKALSDITQYTAVVVAPQFERMRVKRVQFVPVTETSALMIVVTTAGLIKDTVIEVPHGVEPDHLYGLSKYLTQLLGGCSLDEACARVSAGRDAVSEHGQLMMNVLGALQSTEKNAQDAPMAVGGGANLLSYPEYSDVEKAKSFLAVLESREKLYPLLTQSGGVEFTVRIGPENNIPELADCSVVTATYRVGHGSAGTLGIIGPTRMNYARVVSIINFMGRAIGDMLSDQE